MTSKHYRWQTRWTHDAAADTWKHESGLVVRCLPHGEVQALNGPETLEALGVKNGPHNAPQMLARMLREALNLNIQAATAAR